MLGTFGGWVGDCDAVAASFSSAAPFPHVVVRGFLDAATADAVAREFPAMDDPRWFRYHNPIEHKYATPDVDGLPHTKRLFERMQSPEFLDVVRRVTGIPTLESDPTLHGAGLHFHPRGGKLDVHVDYSLHPKLPKERRVNVILYLNDAWDDAWGGALELWRGTHRGPVARVAEVSPTFNTAVIFATDDTSFHGMPRPLTCPDGTGRKSVAMYYVSDPRPGATPRYKAEFHPVPGQPVDARLARLYDIRRRRVLRPDDLWDGWETHGHGYW